LIYPPGGITLNIRPGVNKNQNVTSNKSVSGKKEMGILLTISVTVSGSRGEAGVKTTSSTLIKPSARPEGLETGEKKGREEASLDILKQSPGEEQVQGGPQ